MKRWCLLAAALACGSAQAAEYNRVLPERSEVSFAYRQMGVPVDGSFRRFSARIAFDPARPGAARAQIDIDPASIDAGAAEANEEVKGKNWFDVAKFPVARFVSSTVKPLGGNRYEIAGRMTIKGITRELSMPARFTRQGDGGRFEGEFVLKRLDYRIGEGIWSDTDTVANDIRIRFRIAVAAAPA